MLVLVLSTDPRLVATLQQAAHASAFRQHAVRIVPLGDAAKLVEEYYHTLPSVLVVIDGAPSVSVEGLTTVLTAWRHIHRTTPIVFVPSPATPLMQTARLMHLAGSLGCTWSVSAEEAHRPSHWERVFLEKLPLPSVIATVRQDLQTHWLLDSANGGRTWQDPHLLIVDAILGVAPFCPQVKQVGEYLSLGPLTTDSKRHKLWRFLWAGGLPDPTTLLHMFRLVYFVHMRMVCRWPVAECARLLKADGRSFRRAYVERLGYPFRTHYHLKYDDTVAWAGTVLQTPFPQHHPRPKLRHLARALLGKVLPVLAPTGPEPPASVASTPRSA